MVSTYINHLAILSEGQSIAFDDRSRLKGYCSKWMNFKLRHTKVPVMSQFNTTGGKNVIKAFNIC